MKDCHIHPKISIIVPVYNTENYLERCLDSILNQSLKSREVIIVDDISTDNSEEIILGYLKKFSEIKYLKMKKKGFCGGARNLGLRSATGEYIGFVDSDDWIDTNMYFKMVSLLDNSKADIAVCSVLTEYESKSDSTSRYVYEIENVLEGKLGLQLLCRKYNQDISISSIVGNKVYRNEFLKKLNLTFLAKSCNDDDVFNFICFLNAEKIAITPNTYFHYYQRHTSITHSFSKRNIDDLITGFSEIKKYLENKKIYKKYRDEYYSFLEKCFSFVLDMLMYAESNSIIQNEYIKYFYSRSNLILTMNDYIDYFGARRLRNLLFPKITR